MTKTSLAPVLCMPRDKKVVEYCKNMINQAESCAIIEMRDQGKDIIYNFLVNQFSHHAFYTKIVTGFATNQKELKTLASHITVIDEPTLCLLNITQNESCDWFIEFLESLRLKHSTRFSSVIFSHIRPVLSSLEKKRKILFRSLYPLPPMTDEDFHILLQDFIRRFAFIPNANQINELKIWSSGHVGLFKSLYLTLKSKPNSVFTHETLLKNDAVLFRLQGVINEFPSIIWNNFFQNNLTIPQKEFFEKFYFDKNSQLIQLIAELQKQQKNSKIIDFKLLFTSSEYEVFNYLLHQKNVLIARELIINLLTKFNESEPYSDWALDKIISRLRKKIEEHHLPYRLITKKGQGFVLIDK